MNIKYCGPARDYSGYGEANRNDIAALIAAEVDVTTQIPVYTLEIADFGETGQLAISLENNDIPVDIKILHTTPNVYRQFFEPGKYHIGRVFWETNKLPVDFINGIELVDEVWTGSRYNMDALIASGVSKPIYIVPEAMDISEKEVAPYELSCQDEKEISGYKFYSIFEWTERKNPDALLSAYWQEFEKDEDVCLVIKTYVDNFTPNKHAEIMSNIKRVKKRLNLSRYAKTYIYTSLMDRHQVYRFHKTMNCFVSTHRGEGWGIPQMEALHFGNSVISTACGGIHEYLENKKDALLIPYSSVPLVENSRNKQWYTSDQNWAEIDFGELRRAMRWCYENRDDAKNMGERGKKTVDTLFSHDAVGKIMHNRLSEICKERGYIL